MLGLVLTVGIVDVQAQGTRASISGVVLDENGEPLPGANVVAVHEPSGTQYGTSTQANGRYNLQGLRVGGPYTITASFVGYQSVREEDIRLTLNERREINFDLQLSSDELDEVRVIADRATIINRSRTGAQTNVSEEEIERLPTISRSLSDFARLTPQFSGTDDNSIGGRNERYNTVQVDGATLNDVFGLGGSGGVPGGQAGTQPISLDAVQEFNVDIAPYDVRTSGFTGGRINAITKSGTNEFEGSFRFLGRDQSFIGDLDGQSFGDEFNEQYYVGTFGGPIIENELFFFVSAELFRRGSPLDTRVGLNIDGSNFFPADPTFLDEIRQATIDTYDYDPGGIDPFTQRTDNEKLLVKLDWTINDRNNLSLRHNFVNAGNDTGIGRGFNSFAFANRQYEFTSVQNSTALELNSQISNALFNETRLVYTRIRDERTPNGGAFPSVRIETGGDRIQGTRNIDMGIGRFNQANRLDQDLIEFTSNFSYRLGDHNITFGTNNEVFSFNNLFIRDFYGNYTFEAFTAADGTQVSALDAFLRGQPTEYSHSFANPEIHGDNFRPEADFTGMQFGLYAQDEWDVTDDLRLTFGLRADIPYLPEDPSRNTNVEDAFGFRTDEVPETQVLWSPRFGFNYNTGAELNTQIRGGAGIFSGRPPFVWLSNQYSNTGVDFLRLDQSIDPESAYADDVDANGNPLGYNPDASCFDGSGEPGAAPRPGAGDCVNAAGEEILGTEATTEVNLTNPDFKYPQSWRLNLAVDQELPLGFVATLEGLYSSTINDISARNLNIEQVGESAYGRPIYGTPNNPNRVDDRFTEVILLENAGQGYEYSLTGQVQRRVPGGINGTVAYTYNRARSVNSGTFDQAVSLWQQNFIVDSNDPEIGTAVFEARHRILGTVNYRWQWMDRFATSLGLVYEGRSGQNFSWIYDGVDVNGDGFRFNDLVFVPENERDVVLASENWELLDAFIASQPGLNDFRGDFVDRNSGRAPWRHQIDLRFTQEIATFEGQRIEFIMNLENVLNMLNDDWGRIRFSGFNNQFAWGFDGYVSEEDIGDAIGGRVITADDIGKPIIDFEDEEALRRSLNDTLFGTASTASRWQMQLGVRYTF